MEFNLLPKSTSCKYIGEVGAINGFKKNKLALIVLFALVVFTAIPGSMTEALAGKPSETFTLEWTDPIPATTAGAEVAEIPSNKPGDYVEELEGFTTRTIYPTDSEVNQTTGEFEYLDSDEKSEFWGQFSGDNQEQTEGIEYLSWNSIHDVHYVFVKGGEGGGGNLYRYSSPVNGDQWLYANLKDDIVQDISHIVFYYDDGNDQEECKATISLEKTVNKTADEAAKIGETLQYTYTITNTGEETLTEVTLFDDMFGSIGLDKTTLVPYESITVNHEYQVLETDIDTETNTITNEAKATGKCNSKVVFSIASVTVNIDTTPDPTYEVTVKKAWQDEEGQSIEAPEDTNWALNITIEGEESPIVLNQDDEDGEVTFDVDMDKSFAITESLSDDYTVTGTGTYDVLDLYGETAEVYTGEVVTVTNKLKSPIIEDDYGTLTIQKVVGELQPMAVALEDSNYPEFSIRVYGGEYDQTFKLTAGERHTIDYEFPLDVEYTIEEINIPEGFEPVGVFNGDTEGVTTGAITFTNERSEATIIVQNKEEDTTDPTYEVTVEKVWQDEDGRSIDAPGDTNWSLNITIEGEESPIVLNQDDEDGEVTFDVDMDKSFTIAEAVSSDYTVTGTGTYDVLDLYGETAEVYTGEVVTVINKLKSDPPPPDPEYGKIKIIKTIDSEDGEPQAGVTFEIKKGSYKKSKETNEDGIALFTRLDPGTYSVKEIVPEGYTTSLEEDFTIRVRADKTVEVEVVNSKIGDPEEPQKPKDPEEPTNETATEGTTTTPTTIEIDTSTTTTEPVAVETKPDLPNTGGPMAPELAVAGIGTLIFGLGIALKRKNR